MPTRIGRCSSGAFGVNVHSCVAELISVVFLVTTFDLHCFWDIAATNSSWIYILSIFLWIIFLFDRHSKYIKILLSMHYDREPLLSLQHENLKPMHKSIFSHRLWPLASARNTLQSEPDVNGSLILSSTAPDSVKTPQPEKIQDVTSFAVPVITKHQQKQSGSSIKFGI